MNLNVLTLQPDHRGVLNNTSQACTAREVVNVKLESSYCTSNKNLVANCGGIGLPCTARHVIEEGPGYVETTDPLLQSRQGPIVLPYYPHLLGQGQGAFCGDSRIMSVVAAESGDDNFQIGNIVGIEDFENELGVPAVGTPASSHRYFGVVRGVIEDDERRDYTGIDPVVDDRKMYVIQYSGLVKVKTEGFTVDSTVNESVFLRQGSLVGHQGGGDVFLGYWLGRAGSDVPLERMTSSAEYSWVFVPNGAEGIAEIYPFQLMKGATLDSPSSPSLQIRCGSWTRLTRDRHIALMEADRQIDPAAIVAPTFSADINLAKEFDVATTFTSTGTWYVCIILTTGAANRHPEVTATQIVVNFTKDFSSWLLPTPVLFDATTYDLWHQYHVIGSVIVTSVSGTYVIDDDPVQLWHGGNLKEQWAIPDTVGSECFETPNYRRTLDIATNASKRQGEWQLANITEVTEEQYLVPYFRSQTDVNNETVGDLFWAAIDGHTNWVDDSSPKRSLQVRGATGPADGILEVYGFSAATHCQVPFVLTADGKESLEWRYPATMDDDPQIGEVGLDCEFVIDVNGDLAPPESGAYISISVNRGTLHVHDAAIDVSTAWPGPYSFYYGVSLGEEYDGEPGWYNHAELFDDEFAAEAYFYTNYGATCTCHDLRYWIKGQSYFDNYGSSIGRTSAQSVIDLTNMILQKNLGLVSESSVDWGLRYLYATNPEGGVMICANWETQTLKKGDDEITVLDWSVSQLIDDSSVTCVDWSDYTLQRGGASIRLDWDSCELLGSAWTCYGVDFRCTNFIEAQEGFKLVSVPGGAYTWWWVHETWNTISYCVSVFSAGAQRVMALAPSGDVYVMNDLVTTQVKLGGDDGVWADGWRLGVNGYGAACFVYDDEEKAIVDSAGMVSAVRYGILATAYAGIEGPTSVELPTPGGGSVPALLVGGILCEPA